MKDPVGTEIHTAHPKSASQTTQGNVYHTYYSLKPPEAILTMQQHKVLI